MNIVKNVLVGAVAMVAVALAVAALPALCFFVPYLLFDVSAEHSANVAAVGWLVELGVFLCWLIGMVVREDMMSR